jgi:four helix bundle protein
MRDHKSLRVWIESHETVLLVLDLNRDYWRPDMRAVFDQLTRAALSTQVNISEGYSLGTRGQFVRHLRIAYASAVETADLLEILEQRCPGIFELTRLALQHTCCCQRLLRGLIKKYQIA